MKNLFVVVEGVIKPVVDVVEFGFFDGMSDGYLTVSGDSHTVVVWDEDEFVEMTFIGSKYLGVDESSHTVALVDGSETAKDVACQQLDYMKLELASEHIEEMQTIVNEYNNGLQLLDEQSTGIRQLTDKAAEKQRAKIKKMYREASD